MRCGVTLSTLADRNTFFTNPGCKDHIIYSPSVEDGRIKLLESGKEDTDVIIQSYAEQCDMSIILSRLSAGDTSVLDARPCFYGDMTGFPESRAEFLQSVIDARAVFDNLSSEVKAKFDNDFRNWYSTAGQPEWVQNMQPVQTAGSPDPSQPVQNEEQKGETTE